MTVLKNKFILALLALGLLLLGLFYRGIYPLSALPSNKSELSQTTQEFQLGSTKPDPLDQATLLPTQSIEINFTNPLPSADAFKYKLDPSLEVKVELMNNNKTVKLTPVKSWSLGNGYTLFILPETSFVFTNEAHKPLGKEYIYHFQTINYKGA